MQKKLLDYLIQTVLEEMKRKKYGGKIIKTYHRSFNKLKMLAEKRGVDYLTDELISEFQSDVVKRTNEYSRSKERHLQRCIKLLSSLADAGIIDWSKKKNGKISDKLTEPSFHQELEKFVGQLENEKLSSNTICGYKRIVTYFLIFCEEKGYMDLQRLQMNDVTEFIIFVYRKGYFKPTTIEGTLSGLRRFISDNEYAKKFLLEIPVHLPRERKIIEVYDEQELTSIKNILSDGSLSKRDTAICKLLLETGLRGVDVSSLKLADIDWNNDVIYVVQNKTGEPLSIPLRSSYGNAIADYILHERPDSDSGHLFLRSFAPYEKLNTSGTIYEILEKMEEKAGVQKKERITGSRMTRHNAASAMLRSGVPMPDISAALGHKDPNTVLVYLSTDEKALAQCALAMPTVTKGGV